MKCRKNFCKYSQLARIQDSNCDLDVISPVGGPQFLFLLRNLPLRLREGTAGKIRNIYKPLYSQFENQENLENWNLETLIIRHKICLNLTVSGLNITTLEQWPKCSKFSVVNWWTVANCKRTQIILDYLWLSCLFWQIIIKRLCLVQWGNIPLAFGPTWTRSVKQCSQVHS